MVEKKQIFLIVLLFLASISFSQEKTSVFKDGEWLKFRLSYSGFFKAGQAELSLKKKKLNGKEVFHANGKGKTSSVVSLFFKVKDHYQSYFSADTIKPYLFKRKINEGGYKKNKKITFNYDKKQIEVKDFLRKKDTVFSMIDTQDMISAFYFLRKYDTSKMKVGEEIDLKIFFDEEYFPFKLRFLGTEILNTKFGKVKTQKFMPIVKSGRVFKEKESVTVWITSDDNKIPIRIKAKLMVGSLRADLDIYKGLANPFKIISK
ncbi:MAG: DUF3108 domain-containing protein [Tenacibaculum sp.]|nr:DUF3108 domain-containing protein [Tenacibaculum sp.]